MTAAFTRRSLSASSVEKSDAVTWVGGVLVLVALVELTVLRIGTRAAIHIPDIDALETPYRGLSTLGRTAYFVAVVLLIALLAAVVTALVARQATVAASAVLAVCFAAVAARADLIGGEAMATVTVAAVVVLSARLVIRTAGVTRLALCALGAAPVVTLVTLVVAGLAGTGSQIERTGLTAGEGLAVAAALLSPLLVARRRAPRSSWVAATATGLVVLAMLVGAGPTTKILMLWNFGLSGYFAAPLYALGAAALAFTILTAVRQGDRTLAVGLALLLVGGIGLHSTYQTALVVAGFAVLVLAIDEASNARPEQPSEIRESHPPSGGLRTGRVLPPLLPGQDHESSPLT